MTQLLDSVRLLGRIPPACGNIDVENQGTPSAIQRRRQLGWTALWRRLIPLLQAVPPVRDKRGRPRRRPDVVLGDLRWFRRLRIRWEIRDDSHEAFPRMRTHLLAAPELNSQKEF